MVLKLLSFDVESPFAVFKTPDSNRGFLTFPFPPKTSIIGLLGAIFGPGGSRNSIYSKDHFLSKTSIALQIMKKSQILGFRTNLTQTRNIINIPKKRNSFIYYPRNLERGLRTPSSVPLLQDVHFRLFVKLDSNHRDELRERLLNHEFYYPVYCGRANMLANISFIGEVVIEENKDHNIELITICRSEQIKSIKDGPMSIIMNVPMDYNHIKENDLVELSKISNILYHIKPLMVEVRQNEKSYKIIKSPIEDQQNRSILFL
jgi:CRISPR-associated protein Cas5h